MKRVNVTETFVILIALALAGCHGEEDWTGEVRLTNGTTLSCPASVDFGNDPISCYQSSTTENHTPITVPRNQVSEILVRNKKTLK